jgi:hypothetical protein
MVSVWRWLVVLFGVVALIALPAAISAIPAHQSGIAAEDLLSRITHPRAVGYSGYAESSGGLALPVTRQFSSIGDLFGGNTQMRVWWRGTRDWRVDTIGFAGESDVHVRPRGTWTWDYESNHATWTERSAPAEVRLPAAGDLLPTQLARRLLSEASADEVSRLPSKRIAGRSAPGLRLRPTAAESTIDHVDVWADLASGLAMRVDIHGKGSGNVLTSRFLDFSTHLPPARDTAFSPPSRARIHILTDPDLISAIDRFGLGAPPAQLGGLSRNAALPSLGSIGVYGIGVTEFAAVPLPDQIAYSLKQELTGVANTTQDGLSTAVGPLSLLLTNPDPNDTTWLLTGTVTLRTLSVAAGQLASGAAKLNGFPR